MLLTRTDDNRYLLQCSYEERHIPKQAGFNWGAAGWITSDFNVAAPFSPYADSRAAAALAAQSTRYARSYAETSDFMPPCPAGKEFFPYQRSACETMLTERVTLLADEPGLGKTPTTVAYWNTTRPRRTLIICPASLKYNWLAEFRAWAAYSFRAFIMEGLQAEKIPDVDIVIASYSVLQEPYLSGLLNDYDTDVLAADEGHYLKNPEAIRTQSVFFRTPVKGATHITGLAHRARKFIDITGTPIMNRPAEFWPFLRACARETIAPYDNQRGFEQRYCAGWQAPFGWVATGSSNEEELGRKLRETVMIRRTKKQVMPQLPGMSFNLIPLDSDKMRALLEEEADLTEALMPDAKEWLAGRKSLRAKDLKQEGDERPLIAQLTELRQKIALAKLPDAIEIAESTLAAGEKLVLFGVHKAIITELLTGLQKWNPVSITGDTPPARRQEYVNRFQREAECRLIVGNIEAMGVGYTLTEASNVLFAEILLGRPKLISQAIERCCRIGQKNAVVARFPVFENSVDQWMLQAMVRAETSIEKVMT